MTTPSTSASTTIGGIQVPTWDTFNALADRVTAVEAVTANQQKVIDRLLAAGTPTTNPTPPPPVTTTTKFWGSGDQSAFTGMPLTVHRTYYDVDGTINVKPDAALAAIKADALAGRLSVISLHRGHSLTAWPATLPTVKVDAYLPALNANPNIVIVPNHEPENEGDPGGFTGQVSGYRRFFTQMVQYLKSRVPASAKFAPCLMAWTATAGQPGWDAWVPDSALWDIFGIDGYSTSAPLASTAIYKSLAYAKSKNKKLLVMETGMAQSGGEAAQIQYLNDLLNWTKSDAAHMGVCYWNSGNPAKATNNYRLLPNALTRFGQILGDPVFNSSAVKSV